MLLDITPFQLTKERWIEEQGIVEKELTEQSTELLQKLASPGFTKLVTRILKKHANKKALFS